MHHNCAVRIFFYMLVHMKFLKQLKNWCKLFSLKNSIWIQPANLFEALLFHHLHYMHKVHETLAVTCVKSKPWTTVGACSLTATSWGSAAAERLEFCDPAALHELSHLFSVAGIWLWHIMQCVAGNEPWGESQRRTKSPLTCLNHLDHETWLEFWLVSTDPSESQELWVTLTAQSVITYEIGRYRLREESRHIANRFWMMVAQGHDCFTMN